MTAVLYICTAVFIVSKSRMFQFRNPDPETTSFWQLCWEQGCGTVSMEV